LVAFRGRARLVEVDETQHLVQATATGTEEKGRGSAQADVSFQLSPEGSGTRVNVVSDIALAGAVAQYGRAQGVIADVAQVMIDTFAQNLSRTIESALPAVAGAAPIAKPAAPAPAISVFALFAALVWRWISRFKGNAHQ
jgi:hypothetical protein